MEILSKILRHIFVEKINGKVYKAGGLKRDKKDPRDFEIGWSLFGYVPKKQLHIIPTFSTKNQHYQTCTQEGITLQSEVREQMELSEQSLTCLAQEAGALGSEGLSSLKAIQEVVRTRGIAEKDYLRDDDFVMSWGDYSDPKKLDSIIRGNAFLHKTKNYASVYGRNSILKFLDDGNVLNTGLDWYSGFNMGSGFSYPWLITKNIGWKVGGHDVNKVGYCFGYKGIDENKNVIMGAGGTDCYIYKNSYGPDWGAKVLLDGVLHEGLFFVSMDFADNYGYTNYIQIDLDDVNYSELIAKYDGKDVKATSSAIFRIENGIKRAYPDKLTFYAFDGRYGADGDTFLPIAQSLLDLVPRGENMKIEESKYWPIISNDIAFIRTLSEPDNLKLIQEKIAEQKQIEENYK